MYILDVWVLLCVCVFVSKTADACEMGHQCVHEEEAMRDVLSGALICGRAVDISHYHFYITPSSSSTYMQGIIYLKARQAERCKAPVIGQQGLHVKSL